MDLNVQLYLAIGGREAMRPVIALFYARMAADPWLGRWFVDIDLADQARRLENFLCSGAPGEPHYVRNYPMIAHAHMFITRPMIKERVRLLRSAIEDLGHSPEVLRLWLKTDALWHGAVVKDSADECRPGAVGKPLKVIGDPPASA
jgi:truncated hemoglobin YjbI